MGYWKRPRGDGAFALSPQRRAAVADMRDNRAQTPVNVLPERRSLRRTLILIVLFSVAGWIAIAMGMAVFLRWLN